ncbi:vacuolar protein sorting-associated protein 13 [Ischnura elegans]|uniref:vacuolar protein sorting-associated protein 13 n=1 Tax=Ischnura elegans TaxID=197161 RepID=UPI001ED889E7|nr:vacuolar protein sorting-associated protein 13 [Ischnura elegans]
MVFESIVADLLNRFLGDYVENLDRSQLKIGIWGGDVVLKDLILKQNALDQFDLPVKTIGGRLGKLTLKIPWKNLYNAPVEACIERLFLLVVPNNATKYDPVKEDKYLLEAKQKELQRIDQAKQAQKGAPDKKDDTFVEKLATQIIRNLQIKIQDIHLRYEDRVTCPQQPFAAGFTLHLLSMRTTNSNWEPYVVQETEPKFHKLVELIGFAVYWNCYSTSFISLSDEEKMDHFQKGIASIKYQPKDYSYLLGPIDSFAQLTLAPKPEIFNFEEPKVLLSLNMKELVLGISKHQYHDLMQVLDAFQRMSSAARYRKYRPNVVGYKGHYKEWWKFAYNCVLEEELRRRWNNWDWNHIKEHRALCHHYAEAYANMLTSPNPKTKEIIDDCEKKLDVFNITLIRQKTELEVGRRKSKKEEAKDAGWFSWWGGKGKGANTQDDSSSDVVARFENAMTPEERAKLYSAIGYSEGASTPENIPSNFVENKVDFTLNRLVLEVRDWTDDGRAPISIPILHARMSGVQFHVQQRHAGALRVIAGMRLLEVAGRPQPGSEGISPLLVASDVSKSVSSDSSFELLHILFETEPLDGECDQRLILQAAPLQIVYDALTIDSVMAVFSPPEGVAAEKLKAAAMSGLDDIKERSATGMQYAIDQHKKLDLSINIMSSRILIPQKGTLTKDCALLVIILGKVCFKTVPQKRRITVTELWRTGANEKEIFEQMMMYSYDIFNFELSNMQVLMAREEEDWESVLGGHSSLHLLHPLTLGVQISLCLISDDPRLPQVKVNARLPAFHIRITDERLVSLATLLLSLPLPGDADEEKLENLEHLSHASSVCSVAYGDFGPGAKAIARIQIPDTSEPLKQSTKMQLSFEANEFSFSLGRESDDLDSYLVMFCVNSMEAEVWQKTFDLTASLNIGDVSLKLGGFASQPIDVFIGLKGSAEGVPEDNHHHMKINYAQVDKKSPDFKTKWQSVEKRVSVHYAGAILVVHAEAIMMLKEFGENLAEKIDKNKPRRKTIKELSLRGASRAASTINLSIPVAKKKRSKRDPDLINLKAEISFVEFGVQCHVAAYEEALMSFNMKSLQGSVIMKETHMMVMASLGSIHTYDYSPSTIHREVLRPLAERTLAVELLKWEEGYGIHEDLQVRVLLGRVQFVFLNRFISTLLGFVNNFQSTKEAIAQASANAAEAARQNMKEAYDQAMRISMDIRVEAPIIIVPVNSNSRDAVILDLGVLTLKNSLRSLPVEDEHGPAILDEILLDLQQLTLLRVTLAEDGPGLSEEWILLHPISFGFRVQRNLSSSWYKGEPELDISGHLKTIVITLCEGDMATIRRISSENLTEKGAVDGNKETAAVEPRPSEASEVTAPARPENLKGITSAATDVYTVRIMDVSASAPIAHVSMKFTFVMDGFKIDLLRGKNKKEGVDNGLATLELGVMSLRGCLFSDSSASLSLRLMHCMMEDSRRERGAIVRLLSAGASFQRAADKGPKGVIDITVRKQSDDMFADVRIFGFEMVVCLAYLVEVGAFFSGSEQKQEEIHGPEVRSYSVSPPKVEEPSSGSIHVNLKVEMLDIVLVADTSNIDTEALILECESEVKYRAKDDHWTISGSVQGLKLLSCQYNPNYGGKSCVEVLSPCDITLAGSTPEGTGAHVDVAISDIRLTVFPGTIALLSQVSSSLTIPKDDSESGGPVKEIDFGDIWLPKKFNEEDYWFLKTEVGQDAVLEATTNVKKSTDDYKNEILLVSVPSIQIAFEAGIGGRAIPLLLIQMSHQGKISDWSSKMRVESSLSLQMDYYNAGLAEWEPMIETVEIVRGDGTAKREPWILLLEVETGGEEAAQVLSPNSDDLEEIKLPQPNLSVIFTSKESLEITVTKSCLEVVSVLGTAFQSAIQESTSQSSGPDAPYMVRNDLGVPVNLKMKGTNFQVYSTGGEENSKDAIREICLQSGAQVHLGIVHTKSSKSKLIDHEEELLSIEVLTESPVVGGGPGNWKLDLPVARVERRHFALRRHQGEPWSLISEVTVENGHKVVTLRSAVQVINELREPVEVYYMTPRGNEVERIGGPLASKDVLNLPLRAVYSPTAELFFRVQKSTVSIVPFVWKELQKTPTFSSILRCDPKEGGAAVYLQVVGETDRIPHGKSGKHTLASICHRVYLRPIVIMRNLLPIDITVTQYGVFGDHNLKAGDDLNLPSCCPGACSLVIKISGYLEREWSCQEGIMLNHPEISVWRFKSHDAMKEATLDLGVHAGKSGGTLELSLFSPCWMVNKTGYLLTYRAADDQSNILYHPPDLNSPILFATKGKAFFGKKKISVRLEDGEWSSNFSLDAVGSSGVVSCTTSHRVRQLGVLIQLTGCSLSKRVTFMPRVVLMNIASYDLECREDGRTADPWVKIPSNDCCAFWPHDQNGKLVVRISGTRLHTAPFPIDLVNSTLLRLSNKYGGVQVETQTTEGATYITFSPYVPGHAPALIINNLQRVVEFWEKDRNDIWAVKPGEASLFAWSDPAGARMLCWKNSAGKVITDSLLQDSLEELGDEAFIVSFLDGMQRVILLTGDAVVAQDARMSGELEPPSMALAVSFHGLGFSLVDDSKALEVLHAGLVSSGVIWEAQKSAGKRYRSLSNKESALIENGFQKYLLSQEMQQTEDSHPMQLDGKTVVDFRLMIMLRPYKRNLRRSFLTGLWLEMLTSPHSRKIHAKINRLQIDCQLPDSVFPTIFAPVPPPKSIATDSAPKPFVELSIVQHLNEHTPVQQFKYFKVLVQEFHVKLEIGFLNALLAVFSPDGGLGVYDTARFQSDLDLLKEPLLAYVTLKSSEEQKNYYDYLHFSPLKMHLSFSLSQTGGSGGGIQSSFLNILLQSVGVTLTDVQDVVFRLAYFERKAVFLNRRQMIDEATMHYIGQSLKQLYVLVLGLDVIGNPFGLVLGFTRGVEDLFYEPFQGAVEGPGEFAEGLVLGVRSLFGHTVGGCAGAASRIAGTLGKGIAALSFDPEFQRRRQQQMGRQPANIQEGLARGGRGFVSGVVDGVSGVILKPISGAKEEGFGGFLKGVGKGVVGLVARPTAGIVDLAGGSFDAVRHAAEISEQVVRLRQPRFLTQGSQVRPFASLEAEGDRLLKELERGRFSSTDTYVFHARTSQGIVLLTDQRVLFLRHNDVFGHWQPDWGQTWSDMVEPPQSIDAGILIATPRRKVLGLFGGGEHGRVLNVRDDRLKEVILKKMEDLFRAQNN